MEENLYLEMIKYYAGDAKRSQHFTKVYSYAILIARLEGVDEETLKILGAAALVHDIGIKAAEEKYGRCDGKLQEQLGPDIAEVMLEKVGYDKEEIERVKYLVGHHHTYSDINEIDYQILVEADFIVNIYEDELDKKAVNTTLEKIFKTKTGIIICENMFK